MKYLLLFTTMLFAAELEVDGNLKVTGTIQNDSLAQVINLQQQQISALEELIAQLQAQMLALINYDDCNEVAPGIQLVDICGECGGSNTDLGNCPDYALSFDGIDEEWIQFDSGIIPSTGDFTVELWAYNNESNENFKEILAQGTSGNAFYIGHDENNNFRIGDTWQTTNINFPFNNWLNITVVKESNNTHLFLDGTLVKSKESAIPNPNEENSFRIGKQYSTGEYWSGYIDEVRISNSARYTDDFTPQNRFESDANTIALWHFDINFANLLIDSSTNENHGTLINMDGSNWVERE